MTEYVDYIEKEDGTLFIIRAPNFDVILGLVEKGRWKDAEIAKKAFDRLNALLGLIK